MIELLLKGALSYLLGSVMGSLLIARLTGGVDIRTLGSGNAGATNALRTQGKKVGLAVLLIDGAKGWLATAVIAPWDGASPGAWSASLCGIAVMLGHVYPLWYGFRGGKGVATLLGAVLGIKAALLLPMILTWLAVVIAFGYVSLGSIIAALALVVTIALMSGSAPLLVFAALSGLLILYTHRGNIARIRAGTESRARRLWLFGTRRGTA
ncbi:MAG: glycerol-3-phosphate 1-O-acyltransferase PlsY [Sinobacteraceae bacterium]|nr:glycerol-3-phosphate 1-O-acyltransferase PlsY [Nevskiaceae bacterium]MBV9317493.1 glycerol-3-phosphate 1-O-acyltransferase PlsY [Gammaproteobacteria bacterium]